MDEVSEVHHQTTIKSKNKISNSLTQNSSNWYYMYIHVHPKIHPFMYSYSNSSIWHPSIYLCIHQSIHPSIRPSIYLFIHPSDPFIRPIIIHPLVYLSIHSFIQSSIHQSVSWLIINILFFYHTTTSTLHTT